MQRAIPVISCILFLPFNNYGQLNGTEQKIMEQENAIDLNINQRLWCMTETNTEYKTENWERDE